MNYSYYNTFLPDDIDELCRYIGDENIFKLVFKNVDFSERYVSPLREDSRAGCFFWETPDSRVYFIDYANTEKTHFLPIEFIKAYYKFDTLKQAVNYVKEKFRSYVGNELPKGEVRDLVIKEKLKKVIKIYSRDWNLQDKLFWSKYGITRKQLEEDRVVPLRFYQVYIGDNFETFYSNTPAYAYNFVDNTVKVYRPHDEYKWYTNSTASTIGNIENLDPTGEMLIITKSYKDFRVLKNLGYKNTVWVQNEGQIPKVEILLNLINRFDKVYILFDNDATGKAKSVKIQNFMNNLIGKEKVYTISIPDEYSTKDSSDFYEKYGEEQLKLTIIKIIQDVTEKS